jgi:hypothetical protein
MSKRMMSESSRARKILKKKSSWTAMVIMDYKTFPRWEMRYRQ